MKLEDINALVDAKAAYERAYRKAFGRDAECTIELASSAELREVASLANASIKPLVGPDGYRHGLYCYHRGDLFCLLGKNIEGEVA